MATATQATPRAGEIKLEYGVPQVFALKFLQGKNVQGAYGPRVMFTATDERRLWLDAEDGSDLERRLMELRVQRGEPVEIVKIRMAHGGGHAIRVDRVGPNYSPERNAQSWQTNAPAPAPVHQAFTPANGQHNGNTPSSTEVLLERSVQLARERGPRAFIAAPAPGPPPVLFTRATTQLIADALMSSINAYKIAAEYAKSEGIKVNLELEFNAEDVRASATATLIEYWRSGGTRL